MDNIEGIQKKNRSKFFHNIKKDGFIDDQTFYNWKSELQKELPSFWESMSRLKR